MRRSQFIGLFGGLLLFVFLSVLLRWVEVPDLGRWEIVIEALGWIVILAGAVYFTRKWLAPALIAAAGFLMTAGERWTQSLVEQGSDTVFLGMILTLVVNGATMILLLVGLFLMFRGGVRRFFPPQGGD